MEGILKRIIRPRHRYYQAKGAFSFVHGLYSYFRKQHLTGAQKSFARYLAFFKPQLKGKPSGILLVQMVKDYEYVVKLAAASKVIAENRNLKVNFYDVYISPIDYRFEPAQEMRYKEICDRLSQNSLVKIYRAFADEWMFSNSTVYFDQDMIKRKKDEILDGIKKNGVNALLDLRIEKIPIGDLVYDTYLRSFHEPTIDAVDVSLELTIECALNIFYSFSDLVKKREIRCLLNTYSSYLHHGIPARICLYHDIEVITTGSSFYVLQRLTKDFPYHTINHTRFIPDRKLSLEQLKLAEKKLTSRFQGEIDTATSYMRKSAYSSTVISDELKALFKKRRRNLVIYAHDFYDSPHVNRQLQFADLFQWLKATLAALQDLPETSVFVKIHPNGIRGCKEITIQLVNSFNQPHFYVLDESVSNLNIVALKPDLVATARGTICIEMAYFEIPTVALFDNLYANFKFIQTCYSAKEYFSILRGEKNPEIEFSKEKIYSFYYQAFIENEGTSKHDAFRLLLNHRDGTYTDKYLAYLNGHSTQIFNESFVQVYKGSYSCVQLND